jgi:hypothetical protein
VLGLKTQKANLRPTTEAQCALAGSEHGGIEDRGCTAVRRAPGQRAPPGMPELTQLARNSKQGQGLAARRQTQTHVQTAAARLLPDSAPGPGQKPETKAPPGAWRLVLPLVLRAALPPI